MLGRRDPQGEGPQGLSRVKGLDGLKARLRTLPRALATTIAPAALGEALGPLRDEARSAAPVDTGATRAGIRLKRARPRGGRVTFRVVVDATTAGKFVAAFQDLGTSEIKGRHFMGRAADSLPGAGQAAARQVASAVRRHLSR